ncbi:hypothetical protein C0Q70_16943 [Pomacea canaliculata]|uniref:Uncharacterized protein n=1 Tax=Pomacea canaliculata TaxID=400727 RepID=A0A2T7NR69_POMCA|nr:hypothetical protein C0Q70_16943 [Pomacea canaliculata]
MSSLHSSSTGSPDSLSPYRDSCNRVLVLHDPQGQGLGSPLDVPNNAIFVTDHVTGWPLKRSPSCHSNDLQALKGVKERILCMLGENG